MRREAQLAVGDPREVYEAFLEEQHPFDAAAVQAHRAGEAPVAQFEQQFRRAAARLEEPFGRLFLADPPFERPFRLDPLDEPEDRQRPERAEDDLRRGEDLAAEAVHAQRPAQFVEDRALGRAEPRDLDRRAEDGAVDGARPADRAAHAPAVADAAHAGEQQLFGRHVERDRLVGRQRGARKAPAARGPREDGEDDFADVVEDGADELVRVHQPLGDEDLPQAAAARDLAPRLEQRGQRHFAAPEEERAEPVLRIGGRGEDDPPVAEVEHLAGPLPLDQQRSGVPDAAEIPQQFGKGHALEAAFGRNLRSTFDHAKNVHSRLACGQGARPRLQI